MYTLFIDTHFSQITLVLYKNGIVEKIEQRESNQSHSHFIMPMIASLLDDNKVRVNDIKELIVVNGPGSFTGVRIGVTIAKTMAYCLQIPIKMITSLELIVATINDKSLKQVAINDRNGYFVGIFDENNSLVKDYFYLSNKDYREYKEANTIYDNISNIDYQLVYNFAKSKESVNPHSVNPIYVKKIEVQK